MKAVPAFTVGQGLTWTDALFTATSAVCVTGLIVVDTATYFTIWGQAFLLLLIQLGGLGILTFATLALLAVGRRLSLHHEALSADLTEVLPDLNPRKMVKTLVLVTFTL
ncbi:MAG: potassium transporter TrkG [Gemmatimonadota bacterium]